MQLTGDIFNIPTKRLQTHKVCAIGAAINAGMAINMFHHEEEAVKNVTKVLEAFYPIKENVKIYNDIFNNVYKKDIMYKYTRHN